MATVKQIGILLLAAAVLAAVSNLVHPRHIPWMQDWSNQIEEQAAEEGIRIIPLSDALKSGALFIDARKHQEYLEGHIPGALSVPLATWQDHYMTLGEEVDAGTEMIVYCSDRTCDLALMLAGRLREYLGADVRLLVDGFVGWTEAGGEVER